MFTTFHQPNKEEIDMNNDFDRLLRKEEVLLITGIKSPSTLYDMIRRGEFPAPLKLTARKSVWKCSEVVQFINNLRRAYDK